MNEKPENQAAPTVPPLADRSVFLAIFLIGFVSLGYELLQVRMLSFFLGSISNFLAIPIALFGLALGSLYCHFIYKGDPHALVSRFVLLVFPVLTVVLIAFFAVANAFFPTIHVLSANPGQNAARLIVYSLLFLPPYFLFGALLSTLFTLNSNRIGRLYFFDLSGAALGCFAVPLLFTYADLIFVIAALLLSAVALMITSRSPRTRVAFVVSVAALAAVLGLGFKGVLFHEKPDLPRLARTLIGSGYKGFEEVRVRWNDIARTSLIRAYPSRDAGRKNPSYVVVQDDGISNVRIVPYDPGKTREQAMAESQLTHGFSFALGLRPKNILVMFAGAGRDMVILDALSEHGAKITGAELNPTVVDYTEERCLRSYRLHEFFSRPGIQLLRREGRDFLNNSKEKYDLIFTATNGSVHATRTGHTRKYLDTYEAMVSYLDHLTPDGVMYFWNQPLEPKLVTFRKLLKERGLHDLKSSMFAYGDPVRDSIRSMLVKPSGLSGADVAALTKQFNGGDRKNKLLYSPAGSSNQRMNDIIAGRPLDDLPDVYTDDNPFTNKVVIKGFSLLPTTDQLKDPKYASDWIKLFTVLLFSVIGLAVISALRFAGNKDKRLPLLWFAYFFVSGLGYMGVEIGLIAKVELFVGNPLYAVAVILAVFLLSNAFGAFMQDAHHLMRGWKSLLLLTTAAVTWSVLAATFCNTHFLSIPMWLKIAAVAVAVGPAGICLGMYYPFGVATLVGGGRASTVPATYAIATLSSVVGSSIAMTAITNIGFATVIAIGAGCYAAVAFIFVAARKVAL
jgi:hypothetical protein